MCQQRQATFGKGHILIFLVCFSAEVPELMVCALPDEPGLGARQRGATGARGEARAVAPGDTDVCGAGARRSAAAEGNSA